MEDERVAWRDGRLGPRVPRRWIAFPTAVGAILALLFVPLVLATPWAPVLHSACVHGSAVASSTEVAPGLLLNSPFGGAAWGNGTFDPHSGISSTGSTADNGAALAVVGSLSFSLHRNHNTTVLGPGPDRHCTSPYYVGTEGPARGGTSATFGLLPAGSPSDRGESNTVASAVMLGQASVHFSNGYLGGNAPLVDTCHTGPVSLEATSNRLTVLVDFVLNARDITVPIALPVTESFHYWFPGGFGIWSVDDLRSSAAGYGPGDAFDYVPCS
ncbi:MAG TPA: hypothetical protein VGV89_05810 [Thermoplasmata archaeon]|nr:hypothetical protein [Thermoplasmata archaeon]